MPVPERRGPGDCFALAERRVYPQIAQISQIDSNAIQTDVASEHGFAQKFG
jgi:hypothetical protein